MAIVYNIGSEPEEIKAKLTAFFTELDGAYPNKVIGDLKKDNAESEEMALELSKLLGYADKEKFLSAYGYTVETRSCGRKKSVSPHEVVNELLRRYPNGSGMLRLDDLFAANPDLAPYKKTMMNNANAVFGMSLAQYLKNIGILKLHTDLLEEKLAELKKRYSDGRPLPKNLNQLKKDNSDIPLILNINNLITEKYPNASPLQFMKEQGLISAYRLICTVWLPGLKQNFYVYPASEKISSRDYVRFDIGFSKLSVIGKVVKVEKCREEALPIPEELIPTVKATVDSDAYQREILRGAICVNAVCTLGELLDASSVELVPFEAVKERGETSSGQRVTVASCRGLTVDIVKAMDHLIEKDDRIYSYLDVMAVAKGVSEIAVFGDDALTVIQRFPNLKIAAFIEDETEKKLFVAYSESGYSHITKRYEVGAFDPEDGKRRSRTALPAVSDFGGGIPSEAGYNFKYFGEWSDMNYVIDLKGGDDFSTVAPENVADTSVWGKYLTVADAVNLSTVSALANGSADPFGTENEDWVLYLAGGSKRNI